jgi:cytochrome c oxidase subunit 4
MTDPHGHDHHGPTFGVYMTIFAALSVCTIISFLVNGLLGQNFQSASIIMVVAIVKATLVGMIFMHLKYDWGKLYFLILPVFVMATMMITVLMSDIVFAWHNDLQDVVFLSGPPTH